VFAETPFIYLPANKAYVYYVFKNLFTRNCIAPHAQRQRRAFIYIKEPLGTKSINARAELHALNGRERLLIKRKSHLEDRTQRSASTLRKDRRRIDGEKFSTFLKNESRAFCLFARRQPAGMVLGDEFIHSVEHALCGFLFVRQRWARLWKFSRPIGREQRL